MSYEIEQRTVQFTQMPGKLKPVDHGHIQIEHDGSWSPLLDDGERQAGVICNSNVIAVRHQDKCEAVRDVAIIINDEYAIHAEAGTFVVLPVVIKRASPTLCGSAQSPTSTLENPATLCLYVTAQWHG